MCGDRTTFHHTFICFVQEAGTQSTRASVNAIWDPIRARGVPFSCPLIALQPGHPIVAANSSMSCLVILSLWIRAPSNGNGGIGTGSTRTSVTVHCPLPVCPSSNLLISRALNTPSAFPTKNILRCCFACQAKFRTGIWDSFCSLDLW